MINDTMFYSQLGEDYYIYNYFINKECEDGIFVELGATDGIFLSNTKFFEDNLKFSGVLIEPSLQFFNLIQNRPNCKCYNLAVNYEKGNVLFIENNDCVAVCGMDETMHPQFKQNWHCNGNSYIREVACEPIRNILADSNIKYIDFFSIDVEGAELVVLETMDFSIPIYVIVIELDEYNLEKNEKCRNILIKNGFTFNKKISINEYWINHNYFRIDKLYDKNIPKFISNHYSID
jgi:FkbM family methyltransferase